MTLQLCPKVINVIAKFEAAVLTFIALNNSKGLQYHSGLNRRHRICGRLRTAAGANGGTKAIKLSGNEAPYRRKGFGKGAKQDINLSHHILKFENAPSSWPNAA
ncbi:hypothetical protein SAMN02927900_05889 [Rhizobium mongolense subsp. loessense]|uniref:Uncharacterized protein n=1 Tax=Rhizobium mongolense subsp. loessense TaxID=158890 RepID=A0A1G4U1U3_9HYPH|nr:hypothetical protein SAMN02927900_05889 [Rhizobium mongolense subsp. loessense]